MRTGINGNNGAIASGYVHTSSEVRYSMRFRKEMRSAPSLAFQNSTAFFLQDRADNRQPSGFAAYSGKDFTLIVANHSGGTIGEGSNLLSGGSSEIQCSAEL